MAIERAPDPAFGSQADLKRYRPPADKVARYHVAKPGYRETLETVAAANGVSVEQLLQFNFPGTVVRGKVVPPVVNWYLHYHEGFNCPETADRKNRRFKGNEKLAIPAQTTVITFEEPMIVEGRAPERAVPGVWFGGGYKAGTTFAVVGIETAQIVCVSSDGKRGFTATISGTRFPAIGVGASGGPIIVLITSMNSPGQLSHLMTGGKDFSLAVGAKLEAVIGSARYAKAVKALTDFAQKYGKAGTAGLKAGKALVEYNSQIVDIVKALHMDLHAHEPQIYSLGSPWGGFGLEASLHFTVSQFQVEAMMTL